MILVRIGFRLKEEGVEIDVMIKLVAMYTRKGFKMLRSKIQFIHNNGKLIVLLNVVYVLFHAIQLRIIATRKRF